MALMRWEPLTEIEQMRRQMEKMFENVMGRAFPRLGRPEGAEVFLPTTEVFETENEVVVNTELPGIDPKDVNVEISEDSVILSGAVSRSQEIQEDTYYRSERQFGRFERVIPLPDRIKDQAAKASFKNGLLTIRAPLAEEAKRPRPHKVEILTE